MTIYDDFQNVAKDLIGDSAQGSVSLIKVSETDDDWNPNLSETSHDQDAVVKGVSEKYHGTKTQGGKVIVASDLEVSVPGGGQVPTLSDYYSIDGTRYQIIEVISTPAAGTVAYYRSIVRR